MNTKNLIVTHGEDLDGLVSASLIYKYLNKDAVIQPLTHASMEGFFNKLNENNLENLNLYVLDLNLNSFFIKETNKSNLISQLAKKCKSITWIDHHSSTRKYKKYLKGLGIKVFVEKDGVCTSRIIKNNLNNDINFNEELVRHAQMDDYPTPDNEGPQRILTHEYKIPFIISYLSGSSQNDKLIKLIKSFSEYGWLLDILKLGSEKNFREKTEKLIKEFWDSENSFFLKEVKIKTCLSDARLPSKAMARLLREKYKKESDLYIVFTKYPINNVLIFGRDGNDVFDNEKFCEIVMGGGVRGGDGGFSLPDEIKITDSDYRRRALPYVLQSIIDYAK